MEKWKQIQGYEGLYEISNYGNVRSVDRLDNRGYKRKGKMLKLDLKSNGYLGARLSNDGKSVSHSVHRLVAIHFVDNPENKPVVNHKDGIKTNNNSDNLVWSTSSENTQHAIETGLKNEEQRIANVKKAKTKVAPEQKQWIKDNYIPAHPEFGSKALAEKFGITRVYVSQIANAK